MLHKLVIFGLFVLVYVGAQYTAKKTWDGVVYWYDSDNSRVPAAIQKVFDFSHLQGAALQLASHKRLVADAEIKEEKGRIGIELGHFVLLGVNNSKQFACRHFSKIEIEFHSADMSVSGEPSIMKVEAPCSVTADINRIDTIWIPMEQIHSSKVGDFEMQVNSDPPVNFNFKNIGDRWPNAWTLHKVKMFDEDDLSRRMEVNHQQMLEMMDRPITLVWTP